MPGRSRTVIIGGGIAGLAAAHRLVVDSRQAGIDMDVILCEASGRLGGTIHTYQFDDMLMELGPDSFITEKPAAVDLCKELGIADQLISTDENNRRTFVAHNKKLHPLPEGFVMMAPTKFGPLLQSDLFSLPGKLRLMAEMFVAKGDPTRDESLTEFATRRFGRETFERVIQPLVGGIFTSDPDKLSVRAALPKLAALEHKYGSVTKGMVAAMANRGAESGARYGLFMTLERGLTSLVRAIAASLPSDCIKTHALVSKVLKATDGPRWRLEFTDGSLLAADSVIIATPSYRAADIVAKVAPKLSEELSGIEHSSAAVINLLYRRSDIPHALDGFGFVVPRSEKAITLACSFASVKWPGRVPPDKAVLRVFVGGALAPDDFMMSDEHIECLVWEDLHAYLGIRAVPLLSINSRYPKGMPQYNVGHQSRVARIEEAVGALEGLELAGNSYHGVGIPDCITSGQKAASRVLAQLASAETQSYI